MCQAFCKRRDYIVKALNSISGIRCPNPSGAFYVFPDVSDLYGKTTPKGTLVNSSQSFARALLEEELVAVVPGEAFGTDQYVRLSYACDMATIKKGMERIEHFVKNLS